jgi:hypothetical protein
MISFKIAKFLQHCKSQPSAYFGILVLIFGILFLFNEFSESRAWTDAFPSRAKALEVIYPGLAISTVGLLTTLVWSKTKSVLASLFVFAVSLAFAIYAFSFFVWRYVSLSF